MNSPDFCHYSFFHCLSVKDWIKLCLTRKSIIDPEWCVVLPIWSHRQSVMADCFIVEMDCNVHVLSVILVYNITFQLADHWYGDGVEDSVFRRLYATWLDCHTEAQKIQDSIPISSWRNSGFIQCFRKVSINVLFCFIIANVRPPSLTSVRLLSDFLHCAKS